MEETLIYLITMIITYIMGVLAKKSKFISNNLIPLQNLVIGCLIALIEWYFTKDFNVALSMSGLLTGGAYDLVHNLDKILNDKEEYEDAGDDLDE